MKNIESTTAPYQLWLKNQTIAQLLESGIQIIENVRKRWSKLEATIAEFRYRLAPPKYKSCLTPMGCVTTYPMAYNKNVAQGARVPSFSCHFLMWLSYIQSSCSLARIIHRVDNEIAMQETLLEAQEILYRRVR